MNRSSQYLNLLIKAIEVNHLNMFTNKRVLVTGATGLIGSSIVDIFVYLNEGFKQKVELYVAGRSKERVQKRFGESFDNDYFHFIEYYATKGINFDFSVDYVIQGASNASPTLYKTQPVETLLANVNGVNEILDYARKVKSQRVIYISSSEVYGNKGDRTKLIDENDYGFVEGPEPRNSYSAGKRAAENLCVGYASEYGVDTVIVRPGHIYSSNVLKGDNRASSDFIGKANRHEDIEMYSSGKQLRSYTHAIDCASAIVFLLLNGGDQQAYNISNRDSIVTIRKFAQKVAETGDVRLLIGDDDQDMKMSYSALNASKLESLGWRAVVSLSEGVREAVVNFNE